MSATTAGAVRLPGFHGDRYLLELADLLLAQADVFVETGANRGVTLRYVAERFPTLPCLSCEPAPDAFAAATAATAHLENVAVAPLTSQAFVDGVLRPERSLHDRTAVFWLDAHGEGFAWPLRDELAFVTSAFRDPLILVDDFLVPGRPEFGFDAYDGQVCSWEYVADAVEGEWDLWYPAYTEHTSGHHPLRGWALLCRPGRLAPPEHVARRGSAAPARRTVTVGFHGFWSAFRPEHLIGRHPYLAERYELVPSDRAQVVFYSVFRDDTPPPRHEHVRVFYTGEPVAPDLDRYDFAVSFALLDDARHLRLPNYVPRLYLAGFTPEDLLAIPPPAPIPDGFCSYVFRRSLPHREALFSALSQLGRVDAPSVSMQNAPPIEGGVAAKLDFLRRYKFTVAYENESIPGYTTEKLVEARLAGVVPLYWGDPGVGETFDTSSFLNRHEFPDERSFLERIAAVHADDDLYRAVRARPFLRDSRLPEHLRPEPALRFFEGVFAAADSIGSRRPRARLARAAPLRLNLGSGRRPKAGWLNVDADPAHEPDMVASADHLPGIADGSVDEIEACHLLEHLAYGDARRAFREWRRVLRAGGTLHLELPNLRRCAETLLDGADREAIELAMGGIFGYSPAVEASGALQAHRWGWTPETLADELAAAGFVEIEPVPVTQTWRPATRIARDMRLRATKPSDEAARGSTATAAYDSSVGAGHAEVDSASQPVVLCRLTEVEARPELLAAWAEAPPGALALSVVELGASPDELRRRLELVLERARLSPDQVDVVGLALPAERGVEDSLCEHAVAYYGADPPTGRLRALPAYNQHQLAALALRVESTRAGVRPTSRQPGPDVPPTVIPLETIARHVPPDAVVVEAGAHAGWDTLRLARTFSTGHVHAFEPVPDLYRQLEGRAGGLHNVTVYPLALAERAGRTGLYLSSGASDASSSLLPPKDHLRLYPDVTFEQEIEVETQTLDGWAASSGVASVDLLWLDLQGAEPAVLGSGRRVLETVQAVYTEVSVTEIYAGGWLYPHFRRWLEERGFRVVQEALPWSEGAGNVLFARR